MSTKHGSLSSHAAKRLLGGELILKEHDNATIADIVGVTTRTVSNWWRTLTAHKDKLYALDGTINAAGKLIEGEEQYSARRFSESMFRGPSLFLRDISTIFSIADTSGSHSCFRSPNQFCRYTTPAFDYVKNFLERFSTSPNDKSYVAGILKDCR